MSEINQIGTIASGLMQYEFDYIAEEKKPYEILVASGTISGKLGELNVLINQDFTYTGSDGNPYPRLQLEEIAILEQLYIREYNMKQAQKLLRGVYDEGTSGSIAVDASDWIELREGDTVIKRSAASIANSASNRIMMSKDFKAMAEDAAEKIKDMVYAYNLYGAQPRQVEFNECCDDVCPPCEGILGSGQIPTTPKDPDPEGSGPAGSGPTDSQEFYIDDIEEDNEITIL